MQHIQGEERNQMFMISLESVIAPDAFVRVIDAFVDAIDMKSFGFKHAESKEEGRPAYHPSVLMKLYLYGYRNGIRSSRQLEREARLNMEAMWLLSGIHPKYHTIADFRKENKEAFRAIFRKFVALLKEWELIGGETIAIDSFKIRGVNSLKNNYNKKKIERHLSYIDEKISVYEAQLDECDKEEERKELKEKIDNQKKKKDNYRKIEERLQSSGEEQLSVTDPDAKAVILHRNIVNVGYNIQASSDEKNKLLVEYDTGQVNDTHALSGVAIQSKEILAVETIDVLADKGYHTGEELQRCEAHNITTYVSPRESSANNPALYAAEQFKYNKSADTYTCPAGCTLTTTGKWYRHSDSRTGRFSYRFKRYTTSLCKSCKQRQQCTGGIRNGRAIDRSEYAEAIESNTERVRKNEGYYRRRQEIIEHIFGTLKRQRGFTHTLVKGKEGVLGEVGLMFIGYNLTRCVSIIGVRELINLLRECCLRIFRLKIRLNLSPKNELLFSGLKMAS